MVFSVLLARALGFSVNHALFQEHAVYMRNALVWASQGMYAKHEYLERIFFDAILGGQGCDEIAETGTQPYTMLGDYCVKDSIERPHVYAEK